MITNVDKRMEKYACDSCRTSKVSCSRERLGCKRCTKTGIRCVYSRSGVIRRKRKRKNEKSRQLVRETSSKSISIAPEGSSSSNGVQCHLATDIEGARERLCNPDNQEQRSSLHALSSLSRACTASIGVQRQTATPDSVSKGFSPFEEHAAEWAEVFEDVLRKSEPLMSAPPRDVMGHLRAAHPHRVRERAWLVMYYCIILGTVPSTSTPLKEGLHRNLWIALSDVGVLLEPSETNINAILLVLSQAPEITGPSMCWMLAMNACRMLQALGVNHRHIDERTRERRLMMFWHLNLLDKGLAIIFGRNPTFQREMVGGVRLPTLEQIQRLRPQLTSVGASGVFAAHYTYQKILLSRVMHDIWKCVHGEGKLNEHNVETASNDLRSWYGEARKILEAAALTEKPFCDAKSAKSIDVALHTVEFHFLYLTIILSRSSSNMQQERLDASKEMLHLLPDIAPESKEPYHPFIWQLVCCPFTPLLILFHDTLSNNDERNAGMDKEALAAMEQVPPYLKALSSRNSLAAKLEGVARTFVDHARSVISDAGSAGLGSNGLSARNSGFSLEQPGMSAAGASSDMNISHSNSVRANNGGSTAVGIDDFEVDFNNDLGMLTNSFEADGILDWLSWDP